MDTAHGLSYNKIYSIQYLGIISGVDWSIGENPQRIVNVYDKVTDTIKVYNLPVGNNMYYTYV